MSEQREARILIVDDQRDIARVLKTALELLNRGYFVVDVPSGEEAILEVQRKEFDIVVAENRLPGMTGPELIIRLRRKNPGLKAVLITSTPIAEVKREIREKGIEVLVGIFEKPIDTAAFTAAIESAVFGERSERGPKAPPVVAAEDPLGDIPEIDQGQVSRVLSSMMRDLGASAVVFSDRKGRVLLSEGQLDQALRFTELTVLLAYNFTTTAQISGYLGDEPSTAVHYYDGNWFDIYALSAGAHYFITIVFPGGSQKQMGPVLRFGKPAVQQIVAELGDMAYGPRETVEEFVVTEQHYPEPEPLTPEQEQAAADQGIADRLEEMAGKPVAKRSRKKTAPLPPAEELPAAPEQFVFDEPEVEAAPAPATLFRRKTAPLPAIDIDIDALDDDIGAVPEEEGLDNFWEEAAAATDVRPEDSITREEAIALGLIPKDEE